MPSKAIVYYTDNSLEESYAPQIRKHLQIAAGDIPIISVSQKPLQFGHNIVTDFNGSNYINYTKQIWLGVSESNTTIVYLAEHDNLYHASHFAFTPIDNECFYYDTNTIWGFPTRNRYAKRPGVSRMAVGMLCAYRKVLLEAMTERLTFLMMGYSYQRRGRRKCLHACEPGVSDKRALWNGRRYAELSPHWYQTYHSEVTNIELRHSSNLSGTRNIHRYKERYKEMPYWGSLKDIFGQRN